MGSVLCHTELAFILLSETEQGEKGSSRNFHLCAPGLGPAPVAKMEAMNIQSKAGQGGSRAMPPKSPAGSEQFFSRFLLSSNVTH